MEKISQFTKNRIYELWFNGVPRDAIAQQVGVSGSTVSENISNLPENLGDLRKLSTELLKSHLSVSEAKKGVELLSKLAQLGVGSDQLQEFIQATEKTCKEATYEPKEVVQGAIRLATLEAKQGKSYPEILQDFQTKINNVERLKKREQELIQNVVEEEKERKQALARNKLTEEEIEHVKTLRQNLRKHSVTLENVESLQRYLENMQETGGNPRGFVQFTEKQGSLKRNLAQLRGEKQLETANLQHQQQEAQLAKATIDNLQAEISSLREERSREQDTLSTLRENSHQLQQKNQEGLEALATLLKVKAEAERINEALASMVAKQHELDVEIAQKQQAIQTLQQRNQALENKNQSIEIEILGKLRIRDYTTELETAIAAQKSEKTLLEKENCEKRGRLALADVMTEFLTRIPTCDFNLFYFHVETIKTLREKGTNSYGLQLPTIEEQTRALALKVFEGDLVSKNQHRELMQKYEDCKRGKCALETRVSELEAKNEETQRHLECTTREKQLLEALKMNFDGRPTTLTELRNWTLSIFSEEIERKVGERLIALGVGAYGVLDFTLKKLTSKFSNQQRGQQ